MHFSAMYRLRWYRRAFTRYGASNRCGVGKKLFSSKMRQYRSPDGADGCCITSNKSLTCLQLVFAWNWSNFRHAFTSRGFFSVSWWAFLSQVPESYLAESGLALCTIHKTNSRRRGRVARNISFTQCCLKFTVDNSDSRDNFYISKYVDAQCCIGLYVQT